MNNEQFVKKIKLYVRDSGIKGVISLLSNPPGRRPDPELLCQSQWFNKLSSEDKKIFEEILAEAIDEGIFGLFAVLDGVRIIDENQGDFILNYEKDNQLMQLNDPDDEYLHDIYNRLRKMD